MIRVVIADDHHLVREGIRALLEKSADIEVVGEAQNGHQALEMVRILGPDVLVTDISMPEMNGIQALEQVRSLGSPTQVVILSMYSSEIMVRQAIANGARGYLLKDSLSEELLAAIRAAARGATYLSPGVQFPVLADSLYKEERRSALSISQQLTERECQVLELIGQGHTNKQIGDTLQISVKTVERHRASLMAKLEVENLVGLIRVAIQLGLISIEEY